MPQRRQSFDKLGDDKGKGGEEKTKTENGKWNIWEGWGS